MSIVKLGTEVRREQIGQAALALIANKGFKGLNMAGLARQVGLGTSSLYRHFESKEQVLDAVLELLRERLLGNLQSAIREAANPLEQLSRLHAMHLRFSAGSHLATVVSLWKTQDPDETPAFSGLIYGVTNPSEENMRWLEESLYFRKLTVEERTRNRLLDLVNRTTPPTFLVHAYDDDSCKVEESTLYAQRLFENKVPVEMHLVTKGGPTGLVWGGCLMERISGCHCLFRGC